MNVLSDKYLHSSPARLRFGKEVAREEVSSALWEEWQCTRHLRWKSSAASVS